MRGIEGPMGLTGVPGQQGPPGPEGAKGEVGDTGEPVCYKYNIIFHSTHIGLGFDRTKRRNWSSWKRR